MTTGTETEQGETPLVGGGRTAVWRHGDVVLRASGPWSATVLALLRHLEASAFAAAPRVVGSGFYRCGRETVSFVEGDFVHPGPWPDEALPVIGGMLRHLHDTAALFELPHDACWRRWFGRDLGRTPRVLGHCDTGPWNIVACAGRPLALIDWEEAGPVDPMVELAQACWLNAQLHDDDVAERVGLPAAEHRARQMRLLLDSYGVAQAARVGFVDAMVAFAVHNAADQARQARVTPESTNAEPLWAVTWRTLSASWMLRNRRILERALA